MKHIISIALIMGYLFPSTHAQSDLLITPFRVVLEDGKNIEELSVANTGDDTARYALSFIQYTMGEDGVLKQITEPEEGQLFADRYVRIFPRSVVLAPKEAQIVRLQARMPADLQDAEYRSHLYFRSLAEQQPIGIEATDESGLGIQLIPVYGITIPVIIRKGALEVGSGIDELSFINDPAPSVQFNLTRTGSQSSYGEFEVSFTPQGRQAQLVAVMKGVAVYTPLEKRQVRIPLKVLEGVDFSNGTLEVLYKSAGSANKVVLASAQLKL
jgi:hypothetical protein